jgi:hypothetical protein
MHWEWGVSLLFQMLLFQMLLFQMFLDDMSLQGNRVHDICIETS